MEKIFSRFPVEQFPAQVSINEIAASFAMKLIAGKSELLGDGCRQRITGFPASGETRQADRGIGIKEVAIVAAP